MEWIWKIDKNKSHICTVAWKDVDTKEYKLWFHLYKVPQKRQSKTRMFRDACFGGRFIKKSEGVIEDNCILGNEGGQRDGRRGCTMLGNVLLPSLVITLCALSYNHWAVSFYLAQFSRVWVFPQWNRFLKEEIGRKQEACSLGDDSVALHQRGNLRPTNPYAYFFVLNLVFLIHWEPFLHFGLHQTLLIKHEISCNSAFFLLEYL